MKTLVISCLVVITVFSFQASCKSFLETRLLQGAPACTDHTSKNCDEAKNSFGANQCTVDADCAQARTCSGSGFCQFPPACSDHTTKNCDEAKNSAGANQCAVDADCAGGRTCSSSNFCQFP